MPRRDRQQASRLPGVAHPGRRHPNRLRRIVRSQLDGPHRQPSPLAGDIQPYNWPAILNHIKHASGNPPQQVTINDRWYKNSSPGSAIADSFLMAADYNPRKNADRSMPVLIPSSFDRVI